MGKEKSFTVIELLVVIAIIGLLASIVLVSLEGGEQRAITGKAMEFSHTVRVSLGVDLIGEWKFEEGSGTTTKDSSGNNYNGILSGFNFMSGSDWTEKGMFGKALEFDGSNDYVPLPAIFPNSGVCDLTMTAWSYNTGMDPAGSMGGVIAGTSNGWANTEYRDNGLRFELRNVSAANSIYVSGNYKDKWLYTTLILNNGQASAYINSDLVWSGGSNIGCIGLTNWRIGNWDRYFHGIIDEVQVYNRALSMAEIQQLYAESEARHSFCLK